MEEEGLKILNIDCSDFVDLTTSPSIVPYFDAYFHAYFWLGMLSKG